MASDSTAFEQFKDALNGRAGQPMVLGVCRALAVRLNLEPWIVRTLTIVAALVFSLLTLVVYIGLGFILNETSERTNGFFRGLGIAIREKVDQFSGNSQQHHS